MNVCEKHNVLLVGCPKCFREELDQLEADAAVQVGVIENLRALSLDYDHVFMEGNSLRCQLDLKREVMKGMVQENKRLRNEYHKLAESFYDNFRIAAVSLGAKARDVPYKDSGRWREAEQVLKGNRAADAARPSDGPT